MARTRSISSIENDIKKVEEELRKLKARQEVLTAQLLKLQNQKHDFEARQVMEAFRKSGKTMQELMTFLDV